MKVSLKASSKLMASVDHLDFIVIATEVVRGGSRAAATSKGELFVIIVNGWKPLTFITKSSTLDVAAVLDPPLVVLCYYSAKIFQLN